MFSKKSIRFKLSLYFLFSTLLLFSIIFIYNMYFTQNLVIKKLSESAANNGKAAVSKIDILINSIHKITNTVATYVSTCKVEPEDLERYLREVVNENPEIFGSTISLEPGVIQGRNLYGPYFYKKNGVVEYSDLADSSYYYPKWQWYTIPKTTQQPFWSEPYFDEGGGNVIMLTYSNPIFKNTAKGKKFIGVITCDLPISWVQDIFNSIKVSKTGYSFLVSKKATLLAHPDSSFIMRETMFSIAQKNNHAALDSIAKKMINGETGFMPYISPWNHKKSYIFYIPIVSTGWSMGFIYPEEEFLEDENQLFLTIMIVGIIGFLALFIVVMIISATITNPLKSVISIAESIADGNIANSISSVNILLKKVKKGSHLTLSEQSNLDNSQTESNISNTKNEIIRLCYSFQKMSAGLNGLISQVQRSGIQVTASATQISASARMLEATIAEQAASTKEVSATSSDISNRSDELVKTMEFVTDSLTGTTHLAEVGKTDLLNMSEAMEVLKKATDSISNKLSIINEKTNKISGVVTTINKISNKTNLLSLNASIEAEKAGEYGKGFSVVAREISRLADQTTLATQEIESMVKEMRSSVSAGVMEMDKFNEEVKNGAEEIDSISQHINSIIDSVKALMPQFDNVREGINAQTFGAQQISEAMSQLAAVADQTKESLNEFKQATEQLNGAVQGLQSEVLKFKVVQN